jgi:hypothetical protein
MLTSAVKLGSLRVSKSNWAGDLGSVVVVEDDVDVVEF